MTAPETDTHLRTRRIPFARRVVFISKDKTDRREGVAFDLSMRGMYISTIMPFEVGEDLICGMQVERLRFQAAARVSWIRTVDSGDERPAGMAVEFISLNSNQKRLLHRQISNHTMGGGELRLGSPPRPGSSSDISPSRPGQRQGPSSGALWQRVTSIFRR